MTEQVSRLAARRVASSASSWEKSSRAMLYLVLLVGIALSPLSDFLSVYALKGQAVGEVGARYSLFLRGAMVAGLIGAMLLSGRVRLSNWRICFLAMLTLLLSCISLALGEMTGIEFAEEAIVIAKVFSLFVYVAAFAELTDRQLEKVEVAMRMMLLVYALAIVVGALFSIDIFRSYRGDTQIRAGYKGIIYAQNEASALLLTGFALTYLRALRDVWNAKSASLVVTLFVASFLLGTKAAVAAGLGVIAAYSYAKYGSVKATIRFAVVVSGLLAGAIAVYYASPSVHQAVDLSLQYFSYQSDRANGDKVATVIMSGRNVKFANVWRELSNQNFLSLITGGYPSVRYLIEMDGPDIALIMGVPVFLLYAHGLFRIYVRPLNGRISRYGRYFFFMLIIVACLAGHVLTSAIVAPYLAMVSDLVRRLSRDEGEGVFLGNTCTAGEDEKRNYV